LGDGTNRSASGSAGTSPLALARTNFINE
jgi:hypothetical protein